MLTIQTEEDVKATSRKSVQEKESEDRPASHNKDEALLAAATPDLDDGAPADFSDDEDENPVQIALNKQALLEWLTVADFTKEVSLTKISGHKFKLDPDE